jgi:putative membrane protein
MNRNLRWVFALALLPIAACSHNTPAPVAAVPPPPPPLSSVDQTFVMTAAASDASEIQSGQLASTKARNPRVKAFAAKMVTDHTATTQQLTAIAQSKGVTLNATLSDAAQKEEAKLEADKPSMFDHDYIQDQIAGHQDAVKAFQTEIDNGQDADLKAFATATLPTIKQHLIMAQRLGGARPQHAESHHSHKN